MPSSLQVDQIQSSDGNTTYLNSGTLSNITFPAGMVIKEQAFDEVASIAASDISNYSSGNTVSFTKLKSSSDSYIIYTWNGYVSKYTNSGSYVDWRMAYTPSGDSMIHFPMCIQYHIGTLNAGTHTFTMQAKWGGGTNNNSQLQTDTEQYILIKEVSK